MARSKHIKPVPAPPVTQAPPSAPFLTHTEYTVGTGVLSWSAATPATGSTVVSYNLYQNGVLLQSGLTSLSATITGLSEGVLYQYNVTAISNYGFESQQSNTASVAWAAWTDSLGNTFNLTPGQLFDYTFTAADLDGDTVPFTYDASTIPSWAQIAPQQQVGTTRDLRIFGTVPANATTADSYSTVVSPNGSSSRTFRFSVASASVGFTAQPGYSVSGTISDGASITVIGSGFGTAGGAVLSWDDFESGVVGQTLEGRTPALGYTWSLLNGGTSNLGVRYDDTHVRAGTKSAHVDWTYPTTNTIRAFGWTNKGPITQLYISYFRWMEGQYLEAIAAGGTNVNHKHFYVYGNSSDFPQMMCALPANQSTGWSVYNNSGVPNGSGTDQFNKNYAYGWTNTANRWNRWEFWFVQGSVGGRDGIADWWVDGAVGYINHTYQTQFTAGQWDDFRLGHMAQQFNSTAKAWFDDVYVATTRARLELSDSATYSSSTQREIQIANHASWADGAVSFTLRKGAFADFSGRHLHLIKSDGTSVYIGSFV